MIISLEQFTASSDVSQNLATITSRIKEATSAGADLVVFPEASMKAFDSGSLYDAATSSALDFSDEIGAVARQCGVTVVVGMFVPADNSPRTDGSTGRITNTALIVGPDVENRYDKIHLYDAFDYKESDSVAPGSGLVAFECAGMTVGVAICYDLRFPEQFVDLAAELGAQVIVVPTSFAGGDGKLEQWRILTSARALDSTCYLAACDQAAPEETTTSEGPLGIGHSRIVGPDGRVLAELGSGPDRLVATLDPQEVARVRRALPLLAARRED